MHRGVWASVGPRVWRGRFRKGVSATKPFTFRGKGWLARGGRREGASTRNWHGATPVPRQRSGAHTWEVCSPSGPTASYPDTHPWSLAPASDKGPLSRDRHWSAPTLPGGRRAQGRAELSPQGGTTHTAAVCAAVCPPDPGNRAHRSPALRPEQRQSSVRVSAPPLTGSPGFPAPTAARVRTRAGRVARGTRTRGVSLPVSELCHEPYSSCSL